MCRELHIAYRYGDHYDSVRRTGDNSESPAQLRIEVSIPYPIQWGRQHLVTNNPIILSNWARKTPFTDVSNVFCYQSLQNSQGQQREFGDGQRDRQTNSSPAASDEDNVILSSIKNCGIQGQESHKTHLQPEHLDCQGNRER